MATGDQLLIGECTGTHVEVRQREDGRARQKSGVRASSLALS